MTDNVVQFKRNTFKDETLSFGQEVTGMFSEILGQFYHPSNMSTCGNTVYYKIYHDVLYGAFRDHTKQFTEIVKRCISKQWGLTIDKVYGVEALHIIITNKVMKS